MDTRRALTVLGLGGDATWSDVRRAYRDLMRAHHPDLNEGMASSRASEINEAFATLRRATDHGRRPLRRPRPASPPRPGRVRHPGRGRTQHPATTVTLDIGDGDLLDSLVRAGTAIGRVGPVDRESGILVITLGPPRWTPSQLLAEIGSSAGRTTVEFTLEALGTAPPPAIDAVVADLARHLGSR